MFANGVLMWNLPSNRWASIVLTTLLIRGLTVPFLINQLKATSKLSVLILVCIDFLLSLASKLQY